MRYNVLVEFVICYDVIRCECFFQGRSMCAFVYIAIYLLSIYPIRLISMYGQY